MSRAMQLAYHDKIDVLTVTPSAVNTKMYPGNYVWSISPEAHAKAVIDQLGWQTETYGSYKHAVKPYVKAIFPLGFISDRIDIARKYRNSY